MAVMVREVDVVLTLVFLRETLVKVPDVDGWNRLWSSLSWTMFLPKLFSLNIMWSGVREELEEFISVLKIGNIKVNLTSECFGKKSGRKYSNWCWGGMTIY